MGNCFVLLNHVFSAEQVVELKNKRHLVMVEPPHRVRQIWAQIPPEGERLDLSLIEEWLDKESKKGDLVWVQGEFGATFYMVTYCLQKELIPVYSTTRRISEENYKPDGTVERRHLFKHIGFRRYYGV